MNISAIICAIVAAMGGFSVRQKTNLSLLSLACLGLLVTGTGAASADEQDWASKAPAFTFSDNLEEQEEQLRTNPLLERFAESRKELLKDPHHPIYHFVSPENKLNDPNGLSYWQGRWHLFYQGYPPEDPRQHWGHAVSDDLIHWRDLPYAIYPDPENAVFSGSALVEENRVIAMYHGRMVGNMVAISDDPLLLNWEKVTGQPVIPRNHPQAVVFDPFIWKKDGMYYSLSGGTLRNGPGGQRVPAQFLFRSPDLENWEYLHPFVENDLYSLVGDDGACPYFWPIGDQHILLYYSHMSGGKYLIGDYDTERNKLVTTGGGDFNFGASAPGGVHAPSATPDGEGNVVVIFNMNAAKPTEGWDQIMSLPRLLKLSDDGQLTQEPAGDIESLRGDHVRVDSMTLPANEELVLRGVEGKSMEIVAEIDPKNASMVELNVFRSPDAEEVTRIKFFKNRGYRNQSVISIDSSKSSILSNVMSRPPETANVRLGENEPLELRVFLDRSIVEVFVNGRQCVALRVYPGRDDSVGVSLRAQGQPAVLKSLDAWQMNSIYDQLLRY